jgi:hypothetical protein
MHLSVENLHKLAMDHGCIIKSFSVVWLSLPLHSYFLLTEGLQLTLVLGLGMTLLEFHNDYKGALNLKDFPPIKGNHLMFFGGFI